MSSFVKAVNLDNKKKKELEFEKSEGEIKLFMDDPSFNWMCGAFAKGRLNLIAGIKGSGKSSIFLLACAKEQKRLLDLMKRKNIDLYQPLKKGADESERIPRALVVIFDSEYYYSDPNEIGDDGEYTQRALECRNRLVKAGLDPSRVLIIQGNRVGSKKEAGLFTNLGDLYKDLKDDPYLVSAILVDSWGGVQSEQAIEKIEAGKADEAAKSFGGNAKTIGVFIQYFIDIAAHCHVTCFFVQHCIQNMESDYPKWKMTGGEKLQFLVHNVVFLEPASSKDSHLLDGDVQSESHADAIAKIGKKIYAQCLKSRFVPEGRKAEFFMNFKDLKFALPEFSLFNLADKLGVFDQKGAWYYFPKNVPNPSKWNGKTDLMNSMKSDKNLYLEIERACYDVGDSGADDATGGVKFGTDDGIEGNLIEEVKKEKKKKKE